MQEYVTRAKTARESRLLSLLYLCPGAAQQVVEELRAQEDTNDPSSKVLISPACADVIPNHSEDQGSKACEQLLQLQDQVQLLQKQMRLMVEEAKVKDAAIRKKDEEMEAKDKEIARLRREAYGIEQIDVDTGRVEVVEHLGQESPAKRLRRQADAGARVSVELHGKLVEVKKEKTEAVGQMCQQRTQVSEAIECPLCMEREASTSLSCGHCFCCHADCDDFSAPGAACPMCRVPVTTTIKLFGGIHTLSDMLALPSHRVEQEMMSMDTCENAGTELCSAAAVAMRNSVRFDKPHSPLELGTGVTTGQPVHVPLSVEVREAVGNLEAMRFTDREANLAMLGKHGNNVELMLNELLA